MKIAVIGATGSTGQELVVQGLLAGHEVFAFARNPDRIKLPESLPEDAKKNLHLVKGSIEDPGSLLPAISEADVVFEALGAHSNRPTSIKEDGAKAILAAMKQCGKSRLVGMTGAGINPTALKTTPWLVRHVAIPFFLGHVFKDCKAFESCVVEAGDWLDYTIVQPGPITVAPATGKYVLQDDEPTMTDPVTFADVAAAMLEIGEKDMFIKCCTVAIIPTASCEPLPEDGDKKREFIVSTFKYKLTRPTTLIALTAAAVMIVMRATWH